MSVIIEQLNGSSQLPVLLGECDMMGIDAYDSARYGTHGVFDDLTTRLEGTVVGGIIFVLQLLRPVSAVVSGIHGYRRHCNSWGAAAGWAALGFIFPVVTPVVALAQGYSKTKEGTC
jgi:hypothetical protein